MKETYENLKQLLNKLEYSKYGWPEGSVSVDGSPTGIYEVLLFFFFMWMRQPSKNFALREERLVSEEICEGRRETFSSGKEKRKDIRESGTLPCWQTTVGRSPEMLLSSYTSDRQSEVASRSGLLSSHVWCTYIQGVTGGTDQTSGECSLGQTIPI